MDVASSFETLNWFAVIAATAFAFVIGGLWYGPLFAKAWMQETGLTIEKLGKRKIGQVFGFSILLTFVAALNLALFVGPQLSVADAALAGLMVGLGWLAPFWGVVYLFEMRSLKLFLINAGYCTVSLTAMGVIIGAWH